MAFPVDPQLIATNLRKYPNAALRRLGYGKDDMCAHGFRSLASTRLNEMGRWTSDAIERQLAHVDSSAVRRAYTDGAEYWQERVSMMQAWADYLDTLREGGRVMQMWRAEQARPASTTANRGR